MRVVRYRLTLVQAEHEVNRAQLPFSRDANGISGLSAGSNEVKDLANAGIRSGVTMPA